MVKFILFFIVFLSLKCYANDIIINWYDSPTSKEESILEVCLEKDECHKLIHNNTSINTETMLKWINEVKLIHEKIKESQEKFKERK